MRQDSAKFIPQEDANLSVTQNQYGESRRLWEYYRENPGPQGFLVEVPENNMVNPHFHRVNQFQIFFPAEGARYQKTPLDRVEVHYTDGFVPYCPITTGDTTMEFFTLRAAHDPSKSWIAYMPKERARLTRRGKRHIHHAVPGTDGLSPWPAEPTVNTLFEYPDGLSGRVAYVPAGGSAPSLDPSNGGGLYHIVLQGAAQIDTQLFSVKSLLWLNPDNPVPTIVAGGAGLMLLTVQFPVSSQDLPDDEAVKAQAKASTATMV